MSEADIASKVAFCCSLSTGMKTAFGAVLLSLTRNRELAQTTLSDTSLAVSSLALEFKLDAF